MITTPPGPTSPLRPLGLGEILDRAVSLSLRGFVVFALIYLVIAVPRGIIQYFAFSNFNDMLRSFQGDLKEHVPADQMILHAQHFQSSPWLIVLSLLVAVVLLPLPVAALTTAVTTSYFDGKMSFNEAYRLGADRWLALGLLNVLWFAAYSGAILIVYIAILIVGLVVALVFLASHATGIVVGIIAGLALLLLFLAVGLAVTLAWQLSVVTCVVERVSFIDAFLSGLRRVVRGVGLKRAVLIGLVYAMIFVGFGLATAIGSGLLVGLVHQAAAGAAFATVVETLTQIVATAFMVVYYFDVRVREDGLDLSLAVAARDAEAIARG